MAGIYDLLSRTGDPETGGGDPYIVGNPVPIDFGGLTRQAPASPYIVGNPVPINFPTLPLGSGAFRLDTDPLLGGPLRLPASTPDFSGVFGGSPFGGGLGTSGRNSGYGGGFGMQGSPYSGQGMSMPGARGMPAGFGGSQASPFGAAPQGMAPPREVPMSGGQGSGNMPFSIPDGGVYGMQKWLPGSQGTDIFLPRGSPIRANTGGTVLSAQGGTGLNQGAEMIVQFDDGTFARFRHVQPGIPGGRFQRGQILGTVNDQSMDMLSRQVAAQIGAPDGYQHLDLSISRSGRFDPTGGAGGDVNSAQWLQQRGYRGKVVGRTPGPQEGMSGGMGGLGMGGPMMGPMGMPGMGGPMGMMGMPPMGGMGMPGLGMGGGLFGGMMPGGMPGMGMPGMGGLGGLMGGMFGGMGF